MTSAVFHSDLRSRKAVVDTCNCDSFAVLQLSRKFLLWAWLFQKLEQMPLSSVSNSAIWSLGGAYSRKDWGFHFNCWKSHANKETSGLLKVHTLGQDSKFVHKLNLDQNISTLQTSVLAQKIQICKQLKVYFMYKN